ncbi:MAG: DNA-deoxyinosine glycosylase [Defluviitaleaceae bacterium]|nr:DNA-deoxyinosine glycosylase [Defluviitaleaceae bacterium]
MRELIIHPHDPVYDENSKVLILGTMPSPGSRKAGFYYGHPQNMFWRVMAAVFDEEIPRDIPEKTRFLLRNRLALWDVLRSCEIDGASDSSIKNPVPNDLSVIFANADIKAVFTTGTVATKLYKKYCEEEFMPSVYLPSTSPANRGRFDFEGLVGAYRAVREALSAF